MPTITHLLVSRATDDLEGDRLSGGAIAGIVLGVMSVIAIIALAMFYFSGKHLRNVPETRPASRRVSKHTLDGSGPPGHTPYSYRSRSMANPSEQEKYTYGNGRDNGTAGLGLTRTSSNEVEMIGPGPMMHQGVHNSRSTNSIKNQGHIHFGSQPRGVSSSPALGQGHSATVVTMPTAIFHGGKENRSRQSLVQAGESMSYIRGPVSSDELAVVVN